MDVARIYVGSDHAGFGLRRALIDRLRGQGREVVDLGPEGDAACDYPEFAYAVATAVRNDPGSLGILACATGQGMALAAGKVRGIRAVVPATVEAARLTRFDNNANVLCLGSRLLPERDAFAIVDTWLATGFAGGRHARRIAKVAAIETASAVIFVTESERLRLDKLKIPKRMFSGDGGPGLGWVSLPTTMALKTAEINELAKTTRQRSSQDLVVLVEDAANSAAAFMVRALAGGGGMRTHVLCANTTDQAAVEALCEELPLESTFVVVTASASANPALERHEETLWSKIRAAHRGNDEQAGSHFAAVAPPDSRLIALAHEHRYRPPLTEPLPVDDVFGLLGLAGLVPAALLGRDVERLIGRAAAMAEACRSERIEDNPGASLGVVLGAMAKHGRNKLTLLLSRSLAPLSTWIAHLLATLTRGGPHGIDVVSGDPLLPSYPPDRVFVHVQVEGDPPAAAPEAMETLHGAGQPYIQIAVADRRDLGAEIFRWQMAATVAAVVMGCHPLATWARPA